ncbi:glycosyltransferase involved in cell wall biosynthesis [Chitinivorax tropicus]|uniref:Glycosyltransferase involved in cell wall biosynthesis n=1 Tax=Chitinivorax tropicus TaxID=714531 RepID=A0A840MFV6_9PROT|nr:glycosyltransferase family 1 protein [Chitinivorax tropicus]MBB5018134.1 glycosyltransferase involved in cell wall biosynthesis [Chitinivorax tropicus]
MNDLPVLRRQLRLAIVTETYPPEVNGVAMTIGRMVSELQVRGHQIQLVRPQQHAEDAPREGEQYQELLRKGLPIPRYQGLKFGLPAKQALTTAWRRKRPDLVHVVTEGPLGWSAISAAIKLKLPVTSDFHTNFHSYSRHYGLGWLNKPIHAYLRKLHNRSLLTFVPTNEMVQALDAAGYRHLAVVARGVDTQLFSPTKRSEALRQQWGVKPDELVVCHIGRLAPEKNLMVAARAFEAMLSTGRRCRMLWVGDGPERNAMQARFPDHLFAGMRQGEDLAAHYASADVFLFPSLTETYGNVTAEALASGLAVVAYDYAAAREHIRSRQSGMLAAFNDEAAFIDVACELAKHSQLLSDVRQQAALSVAHLSWGQVTADFETHLINVIQQWEARHEQV